MNKQERWVRLQVIGTAGFNFILPANPAWTVSQLEDHMLKVYNEIAATEMSSVKAIKMKSLKRNGYYVASSLNVGNTFNDWDEVSCQVVTQNQKKKEDDGHKKVPAEKEKEQKKPVEKKEDKKEDQKGDKKEDKKEEKKELKKKKEDKQDDKKEEKKEDKKEEKKKDEQEHEKEKEKKGKISEDKLKNVMEMFRNSKKEDKQESQAEQKSEEAEKKVEKPTKKSRAIIIKGASSDSD